MFASRRHLLHRALSTPQDTPVVSSASPFGGPSPSLPACVPRSLPSALIRRQPQLEHRFRIVLRPVNAVPLESKVDHPANRALDRTAPQRYTTAPETIVPQSSRLGVFPQVADLPPHGRAFGLARPQPL